MPDSPECAPGRSRDRRERNVFEVAGGRCSRGTIRITAHQAAVALEGGKRLARRAAIARPHTSGQTQRRRAERRPAVNPSFSRPTSAERCCPKGDARRV